MEPVWVAAIVGISAALGAFVTRVLDAWGKWSEKRTANKRKEMESEYERQIERQKSIDADTQEFIDRQAKVIDDLEQEMSRRWVAEMALMREVANRRANESYFWAIIQQFHSQLLDAKIPCIALPNPPEFPPAEKERQEQEFELRRRQHNTDLINTEAMVAKQKRPDSDLKSGGHTSPGNGGAK